MAPRKKKERQDPKQAKAISHVKWMILVAFSHVTYEKNENFNSIEVALYTMIVHLPCAALC